MKKARLEKTLEVLVETADDVSDLAKIQRASADVQHETAHKLEKLSQELQIDVADIKNELKRETPTAPPVAPHPTRQ